MTDIGHTAAHATPSIHTIGYGQRSFDELVDLLARFHVDHLIDVRSQPHSRWKPAFNQGALHAALEARGIRYVFMGDQLGGRPRDPSCYRDGKVDHTLIRQRDWFQRGIDRLAAAHEQNRRVAIMCAEQKPQQCHRSLLIAPELIRRDLPVAHIDETGEARSHAEVMHRLTGGQLSLLPGSFHQPDRPGQSS